jgi:hypothetical protein
MKSIVRRAPVPIWHGILEHVWKFFGRTFYGILDPDTYLGYKLKPSATITKFRNRDLSLGLEWGNRHGHIDFNTYNLLGEMRSKVYIYNVSTMAHDVSGTFIKNGKIPACPVGKEYQLYTSIPEIVRVPKNCPTNDEIVFFIEDGKRIAMDLINPDNLGLDQDATDIPCTSLGRNLGERGVFWSMNNPPLEAEVTAAQCRMVMHYVRLLEMIDTLELLSGTDRAARLRFEESITPEAHAAVKYLLAVRSWHQDINPVCYRVPGAERTGDVTFTINGVEQPGWTQKEDSK